MLPITLKELESVVTEWGKYNISSKQLQNWAEKNYLPLHREIGPSETEYRQKAMNIILNEFELNPSSNTNPDGFSKALEFMRTSKDDFKKNQQAFLAACFK